MKQNSIFQSLKFEKKQSKPDWLLNSNLFPVCDWKKNSVFFPEREEVCAFKMLDQTSNIGTFSHPSTHLFSLFFL